MDAPPTRNLANRLLAFTALILSWVAVFLLVTQRPEGATAAAGYADRLTGLAGATERVESELGRLARGEAAKPARERVRAALAELDSVQAWVEATPEITDRVLLVNALQRHREYLDAVGSALANPRSPLRHRLDDRAGRVRAAYRSLPDSAGLASPAGNLDALKRYVEWRRSRL